jgi:hypothetical protein
LHGLTTLQAGEVLTALTTHQALTVYQAAEILFVMRRAEVAAILAQMPNRNTAKQIKAAISLQRQNTN